MNYEALFAETVVMRGHHTYENAGHAFFAVDRPQYRQAAAVDGWEKVFAFFGKHLR